jgi:hypothetical protein
MRCVYVMTLLVLTTAIGCASQRNRKESTAPVARIAAPAAALAFDLPAGGMPEFAFNRPLRDPVAFVGFDGPIVTYSYIRTDDRQYIYDAFNDYERRSLSTRVGVSFR